MTAAVELWFARHQRPLPWRQTYDPYQVWVSEVMLQQTRMEVVLGYFERFIARFPTLDALAAASEQEVLVQWSGLGYYRRARMLREAAIHVREVFASRPPDRVEELMRIPGVGRYTAGAISSIAYRQRAPIVDGNIARIVARLEGIEAPLGSPALMREAWVHAEQLVEASTDPRVFNQGLMEIGALICKPRNPSCLLCPLRDDCKGLQRGRVDELPRPKAKQATRQLAITLFVIGDGAGRVLMRREEGALMNAMWHLPHGDSSLLPGAATAFVPETRYGSFRHTVTNRRIVFEVCSAELGHAVADAPGEVAWIEVERLEDYPHPSYVRKALRIAGLF
jgi:A/G-specific adenine glycosylase